MSALRQINPKTTVILLCDVQERFRQAIFGFEAMTLTINKVIKAAKMLEIPVLTTEQNPRALGTTVSQCGLADLPERLNLGVHAKTKFSMLTPETSPILSDRSPSLESVIILGIESHVCVLQTTLGLLRQGKTVYVPADGVSSCNRQEISIALDYLRQQGAVVTTSESILFQLVEDAGNPIFKPFAGLIKESKQDTLTALQTLLDNSSHKSQL